MTRQTRIEPSTRAGPGLNPAGFLKNENGSRYRRGRNCRVRQEQEHHLSTPAVRYYVAPHAARAFVIWSGRKAGQTLGKLARSYDGRRYLAWMVKHSPIRLASAARTIIEFDTEDRCPRTQPEQPSDMFDFDSTGLDLIPYQPLPALTELPTGAPDRPTIADVSLSTGNGDRVSGAPPVESKPVRLPALARQARPARREYHVVATRQEAEQIADLERRTVRALVTADDEFAAMIIKPTIDPPRRSGPTPNRIRDQIWTLPNRVRDRIWAKLARSEFARACQDCGEVLPDVRERIGDVTLCTNCACEISE